ncbi:MAG: hypothetical protein D3924_07500 [Candidatus Electrothrix sp. AR4]|nr:hypothetical protein [Candidatus Electrothrix sp. AR4]
MIALAKKKGILIPFKKKAKALSFTVGLLGLPSLALACGSCVFDMLEYALPHAQGWTLGIVIWFCTVMMVVSTEKDLLLTSPSSSHVFTSFSLVVLSFFIGAAFLGPLPFGVLGLLAAGTTAKAFIPNIWSKLFKSTQTSLKVVTTIAFICMLAGLVISMHTKNTRSDAEFVLQSIGHQGKVVLDRLISEQNEKQLRQILANMDSSNTTDVYFAEEVSEALEKIERERRGLPVDTQ